jgi:hypothetical protein
VELPFTAHVDITLFNILGQRVATLYNEMMFEGSLDLNVQDRVPGHLATGKYIYRIEVQDRRLAKSIMVS